MRYWLTKKEDNIQKSRRKNRIIMSIVKYRQSLLWPQDQLHDPLSLSLSSALLVCPVIKAYISVTMGWILMKLGESDET